MTLAWHHGEGSPISIPYIRPSLEGAKAEAPRVVGRYLATIAVVPALALIPVAVTFLTALLRLTAGSASGLAVAAVAGYGIGIIVLGSVLIPSLRKVRAAGSADEASTAVSECLTRSVRAAIAMWLGWGGALAMIGAAVLQRTLAGLLLFGEAALLIAAPAMAFTYWGGKHLLLAASPFRNELEYRGRVYSIGVKIALVFIGFFIVSMGALIQLITAKVVTQLRAAGVKAEDVARDVNRYGLIIAVLTAIIFAVATYFLARDVTTPLKRTVDVADSMAHGRFDVSAAVFSDDEVGSLGQSFRLTQESLRALLSRVGQSGTEITSHGHMMNSGTARLTDGAHKQRTVADESSAAAEAVRDGARSVLTAVEKVSGLTYESASTAVELNASSAEVARRMDELFHSVAKSTSSTAEIDATARETSRRATELANVSNDVLVFVTQLDATAGEITRTAGATSDLSRQVRTNAEAGREAVDATVAGVRATQESTRRTAGAFEALQKSLGDIDKILVFINEVTDRTNLLSLNAAIIAAQAGANDFGFSVIADEVRQLADHTRNATKDIASIIRNMQPIARAATAAIEEGVASVDRTVTLAHGATESLATILASADRSLEMAQAISASLTEQSKASRHLHEVTSRVADTITEMQRATLVQAEGTRLLADESERVRDIALQVKRATEEQMRSGEAIARAMEGISADIISVRSRLQTQLTDAEQIATASGVMLEIARENEDVAGQFTHELTSLVESGKEFEAEVAKFRL